jgi:hypothetical protein
VEKADGDGLTARGAKEVRAKYYHTEVYTLWQSRASRSETMLSIRVRKMARSAKLSFVWVEAIHESVKQTEALRRWAERADRSGATR